MLALGAFAVEELIDWFIDRRVLKVTIHHLKQGLTQVRRALLGYAPVLQLELSRLVLRGFKPGETNQSAFLGIAVDVANLRHKLRAEDLPDTIKRRYDGILRQQLRKALHFAGNHGKGFVDGAQLRDGLRDQELSRVILRHDRPMTAGRGVNIIGLVPLEVVALTLAPALIPLRKDFGREAADTLAVPKLEGEVHPLLMAVFFTGRRSKQLIHAGKGLIRQCDEIVLEHNFEFFILGILTAEHLQHPPQVVLGYVPGELQPVGESVVCDFDGIGFVGFDLTDAVVAEVVVSLAWTALTYSPASWSA